jgi:hypothetical protein
MFKDTRIKGIRVPCHVNFEEVNLRFYVRYRENNNSDSKRGVVFIKEIVPKPALTFVANAVYNEHYETMPMKHVWAFSVDKQLIEYHWRKSDWNYISVSTSNKAKYIVLGSIKEFITEHYWGYTKIGQKTSEYEVQQPKWEIYEIKEYSMKIDFNDIYVVTSDFILNKNSL